MSSTAEVELGTIYIMAREAVYIWHILKEMGHKQPATPIQTNNSIVKEVINSKIQPKLSGRSRHSNVPTKHIVEWEDAFF